MFAQWMDTGKILFADEVKDGHFELQIRLLVGRTYHEVTEWKVVSIGPLNLSPIERSTWARCKSEADGNLNMKPRTKHQSVWIQEGSSFSPPPPSWARCVSPDPATPIILSSCMWPKMRPWRVYGVISRSHPTPSIAAPLWGEGKWQRQLFGAEASQLSGSADWKSLMNSH